MTNAGKMVCLAVQFHLQQFDILMPMTGPTPERSNSMCKAPVVRCGHWQAMLHLLALALLIESHATPITAAPPTMDAEKLAAIGPGMQKFVDQQEICGAVLVLGTSQGIVYHEAVGKRTLDSDQPMPKDAIFRIMSMTKPMTALGIMMLDG
jgi:Beta-lactamase